MRLCARVAVRLLVDVGMFPRNDGESVQMGRPLGESGNKNPT